MTPRVTVLTWLIAGAAMTAASLQWILERLDKR